jgi:transposase, IS5 family
LFDPLAVLASRLPWGQIEAAVAGEFERMHRAGQILESQDMFGATQAFVGAPRSNAGRPKLPFA